MVPPERAPQVWNGDATTKQAFAFTTAQMTSGDENFFPDATNNSSPGT